MKYFSLDIETTGLDPVYDQVIQVAVVYDDGGPMYSLKHLCFDVWHKMYTSTSAFALALNQKIFERLAKSGEPIGIPHSESKVVKCDDVANLINNWCRYYTDGQKPIFAGKNIGSFDLQFNGMKKINRHHRTIDVGSMFITDKDLTPPSLEECLARIGEHKKISHDALDDAMDVIKCVRYKLGGYNEPK